MKTGIELISEERKRQIEVEGTSGKWEKGIIQSAVLTENGNTIADVYCGSNDKSICEYTKEDIEEAEANARLIAMAPDLLRSLIFAIGFIEKTPLVRYEEDFPRGLNKWKEIVNKALGDE